MKESNVISLFLEPTDYKIEIYYFFDPFSKDILKMESIINKLLLEYGDYIRINKILAPSLKVLTKCQAQSTSNVDNIALAYKAAEIQGRNRARRFMRFLHNRITPTHSVCTKENIIDSAKLARLDIDAFIDEMQSESLHTLLKRDLALYREMDIEHLPTLVFFSGDIEEEGLKIEGVNDYFIYSYIIHELLEIDVQKKALPNIYDYIKNNELVSIEELKMIYDWNEKDLNNELNKLQLTQYIYSVTHGNNKYFEAIGNHV